MGGKFANSVWGNTLIFSPNENQIDQKASGIKYRFETDQKNSLAIPRTISGGTDAAMVLQYELKVNDAKVIYKDIQRFKSGKNPTFTNLGGVLQDSEGEFTVVTKLWVFSVPKR